MINYDLDYIKKNYLAAAINMIKKAVSFPSISKVNDGKYPYGKACDNILNYFLLECKKFGFTTYKDPKNHFGYAEVGTGKEVFTILSHLDVVSTGDLAKWKIPPFEPKIIDGYLYGRGSSDTKGPNVAALFAVKLLFDQDYNFNKKKLRIVFGLNEEEAFLSMRKYKQQFGEPALGGLTTEPTSSLVLHAKGKAGFSFFSNQATNDFVMTGGNDYNVVTDNVEIIFKNKKLFHQYLKTIKELKYKHTSKEKQLTINVIGKPAHGSLPQLGKNAIAYACLVFKHLNYTKNQVINFINEEIGEDYNITKIAGEESDKTGKTTLNLGFIRINEAKSLIGIDMRFPPIVDQDKIFKKIIAIGLDQYQLSMETKFIGRSLKHDISETTEKILKLANIYSPFGPLDYKYDTGMSYANDFKNNYMVCIAEDPAKIKENGPHAYNERFDISYFERIIAFYVRTIITCLEDKNKIAT